MNEKVRVAGKHSSWTNACEHGSWMNVQVEIDVEKSQWLAKDEIKRRGKKEHWREEEEENTAYTTN